MLRPIGISLDAGAKVYINGAVIKASQRCRLEILNEATFLLQQHVIQVEQATTPLRQLYFVLQTALMDPKSAPAIQAMILEQIAALLQSFGDDTIQRDLKDINAQVVGGRIFDAMRCVRALFPYEEAILSGASPRIAAIGSKL